MRTFWKSIGGSPTNTAAGAARLGLRSAVIIRVGNEHMGRFIREQLEAKGVDVRGVVTDPEHLTALVLLGIRDQERFPLIFYRQDCADMALSPEDIDPDFIAEARCILASGMHLSHPGTGTFCTVVRGEQISYPDGSDGLAALAVADAATESLATGRMVTVSDLDGMP